MGGEYQGDNKLAGQMFALLFVVYGIPLLAVLWLLRKIARWG